MICHHPQLGKLNWLYFSIFLGFLSMPFTVKVISLEKALIVISHMFAFAIDTFEDMGT